MNSEDFLRSTPHPGVTLVEGTTSPPAASKFYATIIDLCHAGVRVEATKAGPALRTVPAFGTSIGASVAINGDFYKPGPRVYGLAVGEGAPWPLGQMGVDPAVADQWYYENFGWIAFGPGWVEFTHTEAVKKGGGVSDGWHPSEVTHAIPPGTRSLVSGFPELVTEGNRYTCSDPTAATCFPDRADMRVRNPRSAMGLTKDRSKLLLVAVDGRSSTSTGLYGTELAALMTELGAWQAFNLDGGGSTEMWIKGKGTINRPSDGTSRAVANHWGVVTGTGAAAHCAVVVPDTETRSEATSSALSTGSVASSDAEASTGCSTPGVSSFEWGFAVVIVLSIALRRSREVG